MDRILNNNPWRFSVAPMMDRTDRHCRYLHRLMTRRARLYTEMLTTGAVIHGDRARLMGFDAFEHPLAFQLGGSEPRDLAAARGSPKPSATTKSISMSAALGSRAKRSLWRVPDVAPQLVADCVRAMKDAVSIR